MQTFSFMGFMPPLHIRSPLLYLTQKRMIGTMNNLIFKFRYRSNKTVLSTAHTFTIARTVFFYYPMWRKTREKLIDSECALKIIIIIISTRMVTRNFIAIIVGTWFSETLYLYNM